MQSRRFPPSGPPSANAPAEPRSAAYGAHLAPLTVHAGRRPGADAEVGGGARTRCPGRTAAAAGRV